MKKINPEDIQKTLDLCYEKSLSGIQNFSKPVSVLADEYLAKYPSKELAIKALSKRQVLKCSTSGFITGFGGIITMPVSIPANISSVLYVQIRMISAIAYIGGYDLNSDEVQTFVYACLAGISVNSIVKQVGVKFGNKVGVKLVEKIPGKMLSQINGKIGFKLFTKFGEKGLINIGKTIPVIGAGTSAAFDYSETKIIAARAYKWFINNDPD